MVIAGSWSDLEECAWERSVFLSLSSMLDVALHGQDRHFFYISIPYLQMFPMSSVGFARFFLNWWPRDKDFCGRRFFKPIFDPVAVFDN